MYLGIDIGGTKTLVGVLDADGVLGQSQRFPTPAAYKDFLEELERTVAGLGEDFTAIGVAVPAVSIDRHNGIAHTYGNLAWRNTPIRDDLSDMLKAPVVLENDAKLACLSEAMLRPDKSGVLYLTISTGIGFAFCKDRQIDTNIGDGGGRTMLAEFRGKLVPWESFASGHAIVERFGKKAMDITDATTWQRIAHDLAPGFLELIAITEPDVIVVGGSVGQYFERLQPHLEAALARFDVPLLSIPPMEKARRPEEAVLYGCYDLAKEVYGRRRQHTAR